VTGDASFGRFIQAEAQRADRVVQEAGIEPA
jgi:hypothetical protein